MRLTSEHGRLVAIGGGEDKEGDCNILAEFVRLAGRGRASIVVMTAATDHGPEVGREYTSVFKRLGAGSVKVIDINNREDASNPKYLKTLAEANAVFFTGGDQLHITALIGGSGMDALLHEKYAEGMLIGGTSAGAAMMSNSMIVGGPPEENPRLGTVEMGPGVEFLLGGMIDTHFSQRGRFGRLLTAVAQYPHDLGLGIDEDTALVLIDHHFEVIGSGAVTVIDAGDLTYTNVPDLKREESLALYGVKVHVLPAGHRFDLEKREPIIEKHAPEEHEDPEQRNTLRKKASNKKGAKNKDEKRARAASSKG
ncbi:MAG TPA: cyanophycinase [Pyrinomonadaceae bacterium]|jgi:cyanophycinase